MVINEQSYQDLIRSGWVPTMPKDYNTNDYLVKKSSGIRLYKRKDGKTIDQTQVGIDAFVGMYKTDFPKVKKIEIYKGKDEKDQDSLYLSSIFFKNIPILKDYSVAKLTPKDNSLSIFTISSDGAELPDATMTFTGDQFIFNYKLLKITATKEKGTTSEPTDKKDEKKKDDVVPTKKTNDKKSDIPIVKSKPLYFNKEKKISITTKSCDDFPFTLGCVNTKIGDLNAKFFGGDRLNDTYGKELENMLDNGGYFSDSKNELTKDIWGYLMNKNIIKESVKKVLKEYINKIK